MQMVLGILHKNLLTVWGIDDTVTLVLYTQPSSGEERRRGQEHTKRKKKGSMQTWKTSVSVP